jgi:hypothetical protein
MSATSLIRRRTIGVLRFVLMGLLAAPVLLPPSAVAGPQAAALLATAAVGQANYGTIKGRLVWGGDAIPSPKVLEEKGKAQKDPNVCAKDQSILSHELEVDPKTKGIAYGFAYVIRPKGSNPGAVQELVSKTPKVEIDQKNCDFLPHSTANQNVAPNGRIEFKLVPERLPLEVKCDIHPWMHAHVMIFDHSFFAVTGPDGSFEVKGVPAGDQSLVVWQEKVGYVTPGGGRGQSINVRAGEVTEVGEVKLDPAKVK